jgi:hypothetical protein
MLDLLIGCTEGGHMMLGLVLVLIITSRGPKPTIKPCQGTGGSAYQANITYNCHFGNQHINDYS